MSGAGNFRFTVRPKWIFGHLLALAAVVGFVNLGFWQLERHDERATVNQVIERRAEAPPALLETLLAEHGEDPVELEYRAAVVSGSYLTDSEVLWQARTLAGRSGHDVLTPLDVGGRALIVDRGWVPIDVTGPPVAEATPPSEIVEVTGMLRPGTRRQGLGPIDPATGILQRISRVDIERLQGQIDLPLYPFYLLLTEQAPRQPGALPQVQELPATDAGPHLSYAVQWFVFSLIALVGYPVLLVRTARDQARDDA